ncbi:hypothetical protein Leryth_008324 [Lithospermum erythrorhizon]|uniref:Receptor-interacting protein n=1 Tax=Lithospermum erythrorhizon TaxID=34254 RepID=A0AAV3QLE6_LITER|nr:hypothetical protein Leryth_008324 [Lithospermum erythrorhizon]
MNVIVGPDMYQLSMLQNHTNIRRRNYKQAKLFSFKLERRSLKFQVRACTSEEDKQSKRRGFLSIEEAGLVEISGLSSHERFLCRLTISSLNLLRVVAEQEGCAIEDLNAGRVCDWFLKDKLKREQNLDSAVLQWDESEFGI